MSSLTLQQITDTLSPKQKSQLQQVASLLLEIYHTLQRMRYLEPEWIQPGPHPIPPHLLQLYHSLQLDPAIIYLYSLLPYIDPLFSSRVAFYDGSEFADFRNELHVVRGRDPFNAGTAEQTMRPWMTPLALLPHGRSGTSVIDMGCILYDARSHRVGISTPRLKGGSVDRNIREGELVFREKDQWTKVDRWFRIRRDGVFEGISEEEYKRLDGEKFKFLREGVEKMSVGGAGGERGGGPGGRPEEVIAGEKGIGMGDGDDGDEDGDVTEDSDDGGDKTGQEDEGDEPIEPEEEDENYYESMKSRPAPEVMRDIIRWYQELKETPGGGRMNLGRGPEQGWDTRWETRVVVPVYRKHDWPSPDFDGDAFAVDLVRAEAINAVQTKSSQIMRTEHYAGMSLGMREDEVEELTAEAPEKLASAEGDVDAEWMVHWELWDARRELRHAQEETDEAGRELQRLMVNSDPSAEFNFVKVEDVPLLELKEVQIEFYRIKRLVDDLKKEAQESEGREGSRSEEEIQRLIRYEEKRLAVCQKAVDACLVNVEQLCPNRPHLTLDPGELAGGINLQAKMDSLASQIKNLEQCSTEIREWISQAPEGAKQARELAEAEVTRLEEDIPYYKAERDDFLEQLERLKAGLDEIPDSDVA